MGNSTQTAPQRPSGRDNLWEGWMRIHLCAGAISTLILVAVGWTMHYLGWAIIWGCLAAVPIAGILLGIGQGWVLRRAWPRLNIARWALFSVGAYILGALLLIPVTVYWLNAVSCGPAAANCEPVVGQYLPLDGPALVFYGLASSFAALVGGGIGAIQVRAWPSALLRTSAWVRTSAASVSLSFLGSMVWIHLGPWLSDRFVTDPALGRMRTDLLVMMQPLSTSLGPWNEDPVWSVQLALTWLGFILLAGIVSRVGLMRWQQPPPSSARVVLMEPQIQVRVGANNSPTQQDRPQQTVAPSAPSVAPLLLAPGP